MSYSVSNSRQRCLWRNTHKSNTNYTKILKWRHSKQKRERLMLTSAFIWTNNACVVFFPSNWSMAPGAYRQGATSALVTISRTYYEASHTMSPTLGPTQRIQTTPISPVKTETRFTITVEYPYSILPLMLYCKGWPGSECWRERARYTAVTLSVFGAQTRACERMRA